MKMRIIILFNSLLLLSFFVTEGKAQISADSCIQQIIAHDDSLGTIRNHNPEKKPLSESIIIYIEGLNNLDFSACPETFERAFNKHMMAWKMMINVTDNYPELRGEMHDLFAIIEKGEHAKEFKEKLALIWDTWGEIEKLIPKD